MSHFGWTLCVMLLITVLAVPVSGISVLIWDDGALTQETEAVCQADGIACSAGDDCCSSRCQGKPGWRICG